MADQEDIDVSPTQPQGEENSNIGDNEDFNINATPEAQDKSKAPRTISVTSDDLLGEMVADGEDDNVDFHMSDDQQFEVLDSAEGKGVLEQEQHVDRTSDQEDTPKDGSPSSAHSREGSGDESTGSKDQDQDRKRAISPILFDEKGESSKQSKDKSSDKSSRDKSKDHRHSGPHRITDRLFTNTRYFIIKSNNFENVEIAKDRNVWSTPAYNEKRLNKAYRECRNVLLVFSVRESGRFQGVARLISESRHDGQRVPWVLPPHISHSQLGGVFKLDWLHRGELDFSACMDLKNPWNENKPVKISRDGQEVEPSIGEKLVRLWAKIASDDDVLTDPTRGRDGQDPRSSSRGYNSGSHDYHRHPPMPYAPHPMFNPYGYPAMSQSFYRPMHGDARNQISHPALMHPPSKHQLEAEALLDSKRRKVEYRKSSSSRSERHVEAHSSRHDSRRSDRDKGRSRGEKKYHRKKEKHSFRRRSRSRSRSQSESSDSSFEDDYGVKKETLLHGSYADYVKEYKSRSGGGGASSSSGRSQGGSIPGKTMPSVAQIASAYQKALSHVAAALQQQQGSSKVDTKAYAKKVDEFFAKTNKS